MKLQDAKIRVDKEQTEVDVKLQLRVGDVEFWKGELDNKLAQLKEEIEEAVSLKYKHRHRRNFASYNFFINRLQITFITRQLSSIENFHQ